MMIRSIPVLMLFSFFAPATALAKPKIPVSVIPIEYVDARPRKVLESDFFQDSCGAEQLGTYQLALKDQNFRTRLKDWGVDQVVIFVADLRTGPISPKEMPTDYPKLERRTLYLLATLTREGCQKNSWSELYRVMGLHAPISWVSGSNGAKGKHSNSAQ